ncbi:MAG TPA: ABC transporter ATP-binding protein, partial [Planctomycetaceae bacterium]|nr:ABC transporter ATP-binding protein [Planctomycetaceae bacterium]
SHEFGTVQVRHITPSLEDVFVTLSRAEELNHQGAAVPTTVTASQQRSEGEPLDHREQVSLPEQTQSVKRPAAAQVTPGILAGFWAILVKEFSHVRREPSTLLFVFAVPVLQTLIFGFAIDTEIENIPTVIFNLDGRASSRELQDGFANTRTFRIVEHVYNHEDFRNAFESGRAKVGVTIPPDYSDRLLKGEQVSVQVLIDGSDSQVATTALNASN